MSEKKIYFFFLLLSIASFGRGQTTASLSGQVLTADNEPLEFASIALKNAADSTHVISVISGKNGNFEISDLSPGAYFLIISYLSLPDHYSEEFELKANEQFHHPAIRLSPSNKDLDEVEIVAMRPVFEMKSDKIVFNVEGTINASGSNAFELLRRSPGVSIKNSDEITLLGQPGVKIFLNGKPSPLDGSDLTAFLRTLQASEIKEIEIITNPSSKYDAQGSAGIINIQLKKDQKFGFNSTLNLSYSLGQKDWYSGRISSNYRNGRINLFGNYRRSVGGSLSTYQLLREQEGVIFDQSNRTLSTWVSNSFKAGMDVFINKQSTLGFLVDGGKTDFIWTDDARTPIYNTGQTYFDSVLHSQYNMEGFRKTYDYNLNYRFENDSGTSLIIDLDYINYRNPDQAELPNIILDATENTELSRKTFGNESQTGIDLITGKADLETELLNGKLELGFKYTYSKTDNDFDFYRISKGDRIPDDNRSNHFIYTELVAASYFQYSRNFERMGFRFGLREEQTASIGKVASLKFTENNKNSQNYLDFFPSAGLSFKLNPKNSLQLNYSRRINRPSYEVLNPFRDQKDEFNYEQGNPFLTPEYTDKFQLAHSYNSQLTTSFSYSHTKDLIVRIRDTIGESATIRRWLNLAEQKNYSVNVGISLPLTDWWNSYTSITGYHIQNKDEQGISGAINLSATAFDVYSQHYFILSKSLSIELSGWYDSPSIWGATFESDAIWSLDFGLQSKFWKKRAKLSVSVSDIFYSSGWYGVSRYGGLTVTSSGNSDSRRLSIYFSYLFGNEKVKENKRKTGLEEEGERIEPKKSDKG